MDPVVPEVPIPSPCVLACVLNPVSRECEGCGRHVNEIMAWPNASNDERARILARIRQRHRKPS